MTAWESYRDFKRLGRKTRLSETQRATAWSVFERVLDRLRREGLTTAPAMFARLAEHYATQSPLSEGKAAVLGGVAVLACFLPAWRASRDDAAVALRAD